MKTVRVTRTGESCRQGDAAMDTAHIFITGETREVSEQCAREVLQCEGWALAGEQDPLPIPSAPKSPRTTKAKE